MTSGATPTVHSTKHTQCASLWARQVPAFGAPTTSAEPMGAVGRGAVAACNASGLMVSAARAAVAKEGGGGGGDCGGRANGGAGGGGPWSVGASFSSSLPKTCAADSFISAQPNLAGCWRARLPRCAPAGTEPPVASAIAASVTCGSSKKDGLAASCSAAGCCVTGCSVAGCCVAGCSVAGCSVVMNGQCGGCVQGRCESGWAASQTCTVTQLEVRCQGCGRSSCSDGIFGTLAGTAASWLPAFTSTHSAPLRSKV